MAKENEKMDKPTSKQRLTDRYRKSRPDLNWDDETIDNDVEGLAADELASFDEDRAKRAEVDKNMENLFNSNEAAAKTFIDWANGKDPMESFFEYVGEDVIDILSSESGREKYKEALEKAHTARAAREARKKEYDSNISITVRNMIDFADKNGLDDEAMTELMQKIDGWAQDVQKGLITPETFALFYKGGKYDEDVADAKEEGRVIGKNENIRKELRKGESKTGLPKTAGTQNATYSDLPEKKKSSSISMFGGIPVSKK